MIRAIDDFVQDNAEAGVGLAIRDEEGRYVFFLAGTRYRCPPGELFYASIGGHREEDEDWVTCARREAREELGTEVEVTSAPTTWHIPPDGPIYQLEVTDRPRPFAFYEMVHPPGTPLSGQVYRIVIYRARLHGRPRDLSRDELQGVIALTPEQVIRRPHRKATLVELIDEGASVLDLGKSVNPQLRLYPIGTAMALAHVLHHAANLPRD